MKSRKNSTIGTQKLVLLALLTAVVVVLQLLGSFIKIGPFSISLVMLPIAIGSALLGAFAGAWLGFVFAFVVMFSPDIVWFMNINIGATVMIVMLKGILAGLASGVSYKLFERLNKTVAAVIAAAVCPIVNTGLFVLGSLLFFLPAIKAMSAGTQYSSALTFVIFVWVSANFLFEFAFNLILSPVIVRLVQYRQLRRVPAL